jgi:photosystem II stability/assembly factor-like uncharacterized protein
MKTLSRFLPACIPFQLSSNWSYLIQPSSRSFFRTLLTFGLIFNAAIAQTIVPLQQGRATSIRGLSVVDDSIAWLSGSKGTVAITRNGGKTWDWQQVKGFEKADFRDIEAFSGKEAIIMSSGAPALILKTTDGGASWNVKYKNTDTAYFFDAMDFANPKHGFVLGDPIKGKFVLMETNDAGETWLEFKNRPDALPREACFAASGTCLKVSTDDIEMVTGGSQSRQLILLEDKWASGNWLSFKLSIQHGQSSQGAFSFAGLVVVGGDYRNDRRADSVANYWPADEHAREPVQLSSDPPAGYQSCVEFISGETFISTGTPGSNITIDGGKTWKQIDATSYNVCRKAKNGKLVLLAGNNGAVGLLKL